MLTSSNPRVSSGSLYGGGTVWSWPRPGVFGLDVDVTRLPSDVQYLPIVVHAPTGGAFTGGDLEYSVSCSEKASSVTLSDPDADWFLVGIVVVNGSVEFRNVGSFPNEHGKMLEQLQELVRMVGSESGTACMQCRILKEEVRILKARALTKRFEGLGLEGHMDLVEENERLTTANEQLSDKVLKLELVVESLRKERREALVSGLIGPETLTDIPDDVGGDSGADVVGLMDAQENLVASIKQQLMKLSNQIKAGQRLHGGS